MLLPPCCPHPVLHYLTAENHPYAAAECSLYATACLLAYPREAPVARLYLEEQGECSCRDIVIERYGIDVPSSPSTIWLLCAEQISQSSLCRVTVFVVVSQEVNIAEIFYLRESVTVVESAAAVTFLESSLYRVGIEDAKPVNILRPSAIAVLVGYEVVGYLTILARLITAIAAVLVLEIPMVYAIAESRERWSGVLGSRCR